MNAVEKIVSPLSSDPKERPVKGHTETTTKLVDDGVAFPKTDTPLQAASSMPHKNNTADKEDDTTKRLQNKESKKAEVRTFSDSRWYVALVKTKREKKTRDIIDNFDAAHRVKVWLPMQAVQGNGKEASQRLDIHNYLFFHFSKTDEDNEVMKQDILREIRSITHVQGLLIDPATRKPAVIPNRQIASFKKMLGDSLHPVKLIPSMVCKGTRVRVCGGELRGLEGNVEDISARNAQLYISLDCLGCAMVAVSTELLEIIDDKPDGNHAGVGMGEWLVLQPYKDSTSVDRLYLDFANAIPGLIRHCAMGIPQTESKRFALLLTSYLEDKRTRLGLFNCFVRMQYRGMEHPLQSLLTTDEDKRRLTTLLYGYDNDRINLPDLMFFIQSVGAKPRSLGSLQAKAEALLSGMEKLGSSQLPSNKACTAELFYTVQENGLTGMRRFMAWILDRISFYSCFMFPVPEPFRLFAHDPLITGEEPLSYAFQLAKRLKVKASVSRMLQAILHAPQISCEVVGCYRKAVHLQTPGGERRTVYLDEVSGDGYKLGEHYQCRMVEAEEGKWYMVEPPKKID